MSTRAHFALSGATTSVTSASAYVTPEVTMFKHPTGEDRCVVFFLWGVRASTISTWPTVTHPELGTLTRVEEIRVPDGSTDYALACYVSIVDLEGTASTVPTPFTITVPSGTWDITYSAWLITGCDPSYNGDGTQLATTNSGSGDQSVMIASFSGNYVASTGFVAAHWENEDRLVDLTFASPWHLPSNQTYLDDSKFLKWSYGEIVSADAPMLRPTTASGTFSGASADPNAWVWLTCEMYPLDYGSLPGITSDVPFLSANDRYQVVAMPYRGTTTTKPEFRLWYAGAPLWNEELALDTHLPLYHATDEYPYWLEGSIEYPFKEVKVGQAARVDGILVEFSPRPNGLSEDLDDDTPVGFIGHVEAHGLTDFTRDATNYKSSGVIVSDTFEYVSTISATATDVWPNVRTVFLPVRLKSRVRAFRVVLTGIHMCAIRRVQVLGKMIPMSDA